ncbi:MAG: TonB-dependent receptor family protein [Prevotellaceae bacterium]|jgi:outer membrane receptor protein involved in Fe transport|nr:TonB-dependent receptor family protein [Prevotellaceae bacterium]
MRKYFLIVSLCLSSVLSAQNTETYTIKGVVKDTTATVGIPYATISVADTLATNFLKRAAADANGKFSVEVKLEKGDYMLVIDATGWDTKKIPITFSDDKKIDLGTIILLEKSAELLGVEVVAVKPLVTQDLDKIGYDVEADPESKTNNVLEMLRKVPLVTVDGEENIQIKGSSSFKIYINGKPSNMITKNPKDVLKSMPASSIKKIEVITDPGAKYDAEGVTAILNIVTQSALQGFQGTVSARVNTKGDLGGSVYFSSKIGKFGVTANYGYNQYSSPNWSTSNSEYFTESMPYKYSNTYSESSYKGGWHWGNLELSYEFDSLNLLSASFGVNGGQYKSPKDSSFTFLRNEALDTLGAYFTFGNFKNTYIGFNGNVDYQRTFKKPDQLLTISYLFDLSPDNSEQISKITYDNRFPTNLNPNAYNQKFVKNGKTDEHTFQIDYTEPFNKKHVIEAGLKYILRMNIADNDYKLYDEATGEYDRDTARITNDMQYLQHIFGAYASYTFKLQKFSVRVGGRLEGTFRDIRYLDLPAQNFKDKKPVIDVIPSISLSYKPTEKSTLRLSYTNGILRPNIWNLNPYIDDSNPLNISYGNPNLQSERSHNISFSYGFVAQKFNMNISTSYGQTNNSIERYTFVDTLSGVLHSTYANIGKYQRIGGNLYLNYTPWKWLRLWAQSSIYYTNYHHHDYSEGNFGMNAWGGLNFTLPWKLKFNVSSGGSTPWVGYQMRGNAWYYYNFSFSRSFLKGDKLTVSIYVQNPFEKYRTFTGSSWSEGIYNNTWTSKQITRAFGLSLSWSFGEMKAQIKKAERGISNDDVKSCGGQGGGNSGGGGK